MLSKSKLDSKKIYVLKEKDKKKPSPPKQTVSLNSNRANILQPLCNNPKVLGLNSDTKNRSNPGFNSHSGTIKKGYNPGFDPHDENIKGCKLGFEPHSGNIKGSNPGFTSHSENIKGSNPLKPCNNGEMAKTLPRALMKCKRNRENSRASMLDKENLVPQSDTRGSSTSLSQGKTFCFFSCPGCPLKAALRIYHF